MKEKNKRQEFGPMPDVGFIRLPQVLYYLGISKTTFYQNIENGIFPKPKKLTARTSVWSVEDIRNLIDRVNEQIDTKG